MRFRIFKLDNVELCVANSKVFRPPCIKNKTVEPHNNTVSGKNKEISEKNRFTE